MKYIDLTQKFDSNMPVYPGDPKSDLSQVAFIESDGYSDHKISSVMHVGTHIDSPLHMVAGGKKIYEYPVEKFIGRGVLVDARGVKQINEGLLENISLENGDIVLVMTGHDKNFRDENYYFSTPFFTLDFAKTCTNAKVSIVGMDTPGPDNPPFPVHKRTFIR